MTCHRTNPMAVGSRRAEKRAHTPMHANTVAVFTETGSASVKGTPQKKEAKKFEFEPWRQASKFGSWKSSFRRKVMTGSVHSKLVRVAYRN